MNEIWKEVKGYEGLYEVSNTGKVRSKRGILKGTDNGYGYLSVALCKDGKKKRFYIHRLVAVHFIDNPLNLPQVNHKDENKTNNSVDNLEWCTNKYNQHYSQTFVKGGEASKKKVNQFDLSGNLIKTWDSQTDAANTLHIRQGHISDCCIGAIKTYKGYIWRIA